MKYTDDKGITWLPFTIEYKHPIDDQKFSFTIWAVDLADAIERLEYIRENAFVSGQLLEVIDDKRRLH